MEHPPIHEPAWLRALRRRRGEGQLLRAYLIRGGDPTAFFLRQRSQARETQQARATQVLTRYLK